MLRLAATLALLALSPIARAHPMGTLSTNRSAILVLGSDDTRLRYTVDFAEVPSVAEHARVQAMGADAYAPARMAELLPSIHLRVDGVERPLAIDRCFESGGSGEGGLPTVLLVCELRAAPIASGRVELEDDAFAGLVGWREMRVVEPGEDVPLPFAAPPAEMTRSEIDAAVTRKDDRLASLLDARDLSTPFALGALLSAMALGAGHALSPGHGKTIVAAYLVGSRGTVGQALLLGLTVTITHVSSVMLLGAVTLWLSQYVVAARLYPWIGVLSGLGVVLVGAGLLRSRWHAWRRRGVTFHAHDHGHDHGHSHSHSHDHGHQEGSLRRLLVLGLSGGAVPCPSALVVLLAAIALHRIAFGMLLLVAFSVGLAGVLMAIGVLVVRARGLLDRFGAGGRAMGWLPIASAVVVMALGVGIAIESAREGGIL